jgi:hypothetical protein
MVNEHKGAIDKIRYALDQEKPLEIALPVYGMEQRRYVDLLLSHYLEACGLELLKDRLLYCIHEVAGNAHKANVKRLFFELHNYDIHDYTHYSEGMDKFKQSVYAEIGHYNWLLETRGFSVRFRFHLKEGSLNLQVINSSRLLKVEQERIETKMEIARHYTNLADAYPSSEDFTEGAGLGIVMIHVMLRAIGFQNFTFSVYEQAKETVSSLVLDTTTCEPCFPALDSEAVR